jgi:predicted TIM-barrel fold metal-dependent hydrolase
MQIIDAQIHCWPADQDAHEWEGGAARSHWRHCSVDDVLALLDREGVERAVLVPPPWSGWDPSYCLAAANAHPDRLAVVGLFDPTAPGAQEALRNWRQPGMLGLRMLPFRSPNDVIMDDPDYDWFWRIAAETALPVKLYYPRGMARLAGVLARYPDLKLIICHAGRHATGGPVDEAAWHDAVDLHALARYPGVAVKMSSLPNFSTEPYPFANLHPHLKAIYEHFGPRRIFWGSDATRLRLTYAENLRLFTEALDFLSAEDREWILGRGIAEYVGWPL